MKNLNCKNCGGTMVLDASAMTAVCHYCGTKYVLNHEDTDYFKSFFLQMNKFLSLSNDEKLRRQEADKFWNGASLETFSCVDGNSIGIKYMHRYTEKEAEIYVARKNIIFYYKEGMVNLAEQYRREVSLLDYPSVDTRNLANYFPKVNSGFALTNGGSILVVDKDEDEYPLRLFGNLDERHVAWIISRMENLCCVLEYNNLVHPSINIDTLFINPYTHQASLYGDWWKVSKKNSKSYDGRSILTADQNLIGIRETAANLLGFNSAKEVKASDKVREKLVEFIKSKPRENAYEDFAYWDEMLIKAFGERKFINFDTNDEEVYKKES